MSSTYQKQLPFWVTVSYKGTVMVLVAGCFHTLLIINERMGREMNYDWIDGIAATLKSHTHYTGIDLGYCEVCNWASASEPHSNVEFVCMVHVSPLQCRVCLYGTCIPTPMSSLSVWYICLYVAASVVNSAGHSNPTSLLPPHVRPISPFCLWTIPTVRLHLSSTNRDI